MNELPERLLDVIDPPAGGWERLRARREAMEMQRGPWLAFAAGICVAALGVVVTKPVPRASLTLPPDSARLQGTSVADEPLKLLDDGRASQLPASEGVRLYWAERPER